MMSATLLLSHEIALLRYVCACLTAFADRQTRRCISTRFHGAPLVLIDFFAVSIGLDAGDTYALYCVISANAYQ